MSWGLLRLGKHNGPPLLLGYKWNKDLEMGTQSCPHLLCRRYKFSDKIADPHYFFCKISGGAGAENDSCLGSLYNASY